MCVLIGELISSSSNINLAVIDRHFIIYKIAELEKNLNWSIKIPIVDFRAMLIRRVATSAILPVEHECDELIGLQLRIYTPVQSPTKPS